MCLLFICLSFFVVVVACCSVHCDTHRHSFDRSVFLFFFALSSKAWISYTPWCDWDFISSFSLSHSHFCHFHFGSYSRFPLILWVMQTCLNVSLPLEIESRRNDLMISTTFPMICPVQVRSRNPLKCKRVNRGKRTRKNKKGNEAI